MEYLKELKRTLKKKHLLIIGKTEIDRKNFITEIINNVGYASFRFPPKMKKFEDYIGFVKKLGIYTPWHEQINYNLNAMFEFHEEWIMDNNSLVVIDEFQYMEDPWKREIIRKYIDEIESKRKGKNTIHLIISQENEGGLIDKLANELYFKENYNRSNKQIIKQNLEVIDISEYINEHKI